MINAPVSDGIADKDNKFKVTTNWQTWFQQASIILIGAQQSGTTAQRPAGSKVWIGRPYFDTTLAKPIWVKTVAATSPYAVTWVDATGTTV